MGAQNKTPKASTNKKSLQYLFDLDSRTELSNGRRQSFESENEEFLSLITDCTVTYTFTDPSKSPSQQDLKRLKLIQLLSLIKNSKHPLHAQILSPLFSMLSTNRFRPLTPPSNALLLYLLPEDEDLCANPAPSCLTCKLHTISCSASSSAPIQKHSETSLINPSFSVFSIDQKQCGIGELLEIWGSIINGFTVPLKEEHKLFLMRVLIPLHKPKGMLVYHRQLTYCVSQFVQKEPALGGVVVRGVLKYWPVTNCPKEVLLVGELEELVGDIDPEQYRKLALPLCTQITKCLNSWNSQVAERALYVWNSKYFVKMALQATEDVFPVIVEGMEKNLKWHWSKSVKQLTENVKAMLEEMEPGLYTPVPPEARIPRNPRLGRRRRRGKRSGRE
ncbi:protein phosphatase 2A regulatory B subunit family protein [Actinidia rufa]|uniref:Protein phosphatase 2A regulatory B subunit family protein n=1 Tax=Actinidia rufa TaxID=165716 RepID=A0A7J0F7G9_9ERIC|nr:protein phosphatase 2A regulatory B subunit family protein [Actinidia rufa]